eukprot:CAMPEP_0172493576 /NCGR_PEP_ID=MMETSP1066-20121228/25007_1 /TAXON_ID=671091 /ORGANISM="Coscinodiscus wailesii, Strain CCMP2513" /LENGTH=387 /DNA_ID=CAMNT_0013263797 /DNA_START=86 /DNA_END=1249 /DNA_ORIENTATION=+
MHLFRIASVITALGVLAVLFLNEGVIFSSIMISKSIDVSHRRAQNEEHAGKLFNDIFVPTDYWRRPSQDQRWNPEPLPVCCFDEIPRKEGRTSCRLEKDDVRYYGPGMGYTAKDLKKALRARGGDLVVIGDSVSRDWVEHLQCYLSGITNDNIKAEIHEGFLNSFPEWRHRPYQEMTAFEVPPEENGLMMQRVLYSKLYYEDTKVFPSLESNLAAIEYFTNIYPRDTWRRKPVLVINIGLQYNALTPGDVEQLRSDWRAIIKKCYKLHAQCIFRETSPQYFETMKGDGIYPGEQTGDCIQEPKKSFGILSQWRNDMLKGVLREFRHRDSVKKGGFLKLMPLFEKLEGLHVRYLQSGDCTHFVHDAEMYEPFDVSLTQALIDSLDVIS